MKTKRRNVSVKLVPVFLILLSICIFSACSKDKSNLLGGENYVVSQKNPIKKENKRIVSVSTQVTEIICDLGCMDRLVARTDFCVFPKEVTKILSIGGVNNPNIEKIISLNPDIVITSSMLPKRLFSSIEQAGLPIISFKETPTIEGMYDVISILGTIVKKENVADSIINDCKQRLEQVKTNCEKLQKEKHISKPKVYYVVGFGNGGDFSAGKDTYINEIFTLAGGDNIAKECVNWTFSQELLFKNQPEYIFIRPEDVSSFCSMYPYSELTAVKQGRVFGISGLDAQTPRSISAIEFISKTIYQN